MASLEFIELMEKIHKERYEIHSITINAERQNGGFSTKATVVLEKGGHQISIESQSWDFIQYAIELRRSADIYGKVKFTRVKDLNKYYEDVEYLADKDKQKVKDAWEDIRLGKFTFNYESLKLVEEFLSNNRNVKDTKYLPLKNDYHYILALALTEAREFLNLQNKLIQNKPNIQNFTNAGEEITKAFRSRGNALKDFQYYRSFVNFDVEDLNKRIIEQTKVIDDTIKELIRRKTVPSNIAIPKIMDIYSRCLELSAPILNLLRIGLELKNGISSPQKNYPLTRNVIILRGDPNYGHLFSCLDGTIRHSDAHISYGISGGEVHLLDIRSKKPKLIKTYTFDEIHKMTNSLLYELLPAIFYTLSIHEIAAFLVVLTSFEYKLLLLSIGNC